ncbi:phage major capsid protein [uncultured Roseobacter sp.]|uniref:phage major capsid protein n=1 Tax=uncultured Roseobacter sp. TaxID=114847 RepID=UPI0026346846|nr:phage major capsid protein [uncultured Roseobacter sp.]
MKRLLTTAAAVLSACAPQSLGASAFDHFTLLLKIEAAGGHYQTRDGEPSLAEINEVQSKLLSTFETFKEKNDERLAEIEKRGAEDPVAREQVDKITEELKGLKSIRDDLDKLAKQASRPAGGQGADEKLTPEQIEHRDKFITMLRAPESEQAKAELQDIQKRAVTTTTDGAGGYAVPEVISRTIHRELNEISPLRNMVSVVQAGSKDYKELVDTRGATYGWVGEGDARNETGTPSLEEIAPTFGMIYAYPKAAEESLDDIFFNVESWLTTAIVEGFAAGEENAIVNGDGVKKPTGFLNGAKTLEKDGVRAFGTLQYVASGVADAVSNADRYIDLVQALKKGYRKNAEWLMNKSTVGEVMKLKDGDGNYLWKMGDIKSGQPDRLLGYGIGESEEMPDLAANAFPIAFGDFKAGYVLADLVGFRLTRDEITTPGYVKWYARRRLGGALKLSEAIKLMRAEADA